jgi:amino-acid N-acetyltransferase
MTIRKATARDVQSVFALTNAMAKKGLMLPRSKYRIVTMLSSFSVAETDTGEIAGAGALVPLWTDMCEIMSLAVDPRYQGRGVGKLLVQALIEEGRRLEMPEVITLTYQVDFFRNLGFTVTDKDRFPRKMWRECLECPKLEECDETAMYLKLS